MPEEPRLNGIPIFWFVILAILLFGFVLLREPQKNNQIVRPVPDGPAAPVVPQLPDVIAELSRSKSLGEDRAQAAIAILTQRQDEARLFQGRQLYDDARAEFNGAIDYLRSGLSRRFEDGDSQQVAIRMLNGKQKIETFVSWVRDLNGPVIGAGPLDTFAEALDKWLNHVREQNAQAIEQLRADLDRCRLREWSQLMN